MANSNAVFTKQLCYGKGARKMFTAQMYEGKMTFHLREYMNNQPTKKGTYKLP